MPPKAKAKAAAGNPEPIKTGIDKHPRGQDSLGTRMASKSHSEEESEKNAALAKRLEEVEKQRADLESNLEEKTAIAEQQEVELSTVKHESELVDETLTKLQKDVTDNIRRLVQFGVPDPGPGSPSGKDAAGEDGAPAAGPSNAHVTGLVSSVHQVLAMAKEAASPSRKQQLQQQMQKEIADLKEQLRTERENHSAKMDERERQIAKLSTLVADLQKQNRDVIGTSSEGVRGARVENQKLREELEQIKKERDMLDLWNGENMRIMTRQEEQLAGNKRTDVLLREQEARFQNESNRLVKSWNAKKQEYEHSMKNITRLETQVEKLQEEHGRKDMLILDLRKASKAKEIEQFQKRNERLVAENQDKTIKIRDLELKLKKLGAQFEMSSQQKSDGMGLSLDAVAQLLTQTQLQRAGKSGGSSTPEHQSQHQSPTRGKFSRPAASAADVHVSVMRSKLNDKDKEIGALQANIRSYIAKDIETKTKLRDQTGMKRKYEHQVDQYRYEQNIVNSRWERKLAAAEEEKETLRLQMEKSHGFGLLSQGSLAGFGQGSPDISRTPGAGGPGGGSVRGTRNFGSTTLKSPDFDVTAFDLEPEKEDEVSVSRELEAEKKKAEAILRGDTAANKPHWTSSIEQGRPRSAFTGKQLSSGLLSSQTSAAVNVGSLTKRPATAAGGGK
eukprot:CAMPEP_0178999080 /NCGR_PEP_ID=MMETSP0795-20121207/9857_1 /TAXON_ID=88552 /ORGANISM="Amoebophrya sp., Strain Ameob2" /LENGTH=672 /DNA_ID=CAMNT_0020691805 /DNA_START=202 /DNA_END=2221 /DNA_ORIENTATION=-